MKGDNEILGNQQKGFDTKAQRLAIYLYNKSYTRVLTSQNRWRLTSSSQSKPISQSSLDIIIFLS